MLIKKNLESCEVSLKACWCKNEFFIDRNTCRHVVIVLTCFRLILLHSDCFYLLTPDWSIQIRRQSESRIFSVSTCVNFNQLTLSVVLSLTRLKQSGKKRRSKNLSADFYSRLFYSSCVIGGWVILRARRR